MKDDAERREASRQFYNAGDVDNAVSIAREAWHGGDGSVLYAVAHALEDDGFGALESGQKGGRQTGRDLLDRAEALFAELVESDPAWVGPLGRLLRRRAEYEMAEETSETLGPRANPAAAGAAAFSLGLQFSENGDEEGAERWYTEGAQWADADAAWNLACLLSENYAGLRYADEVRWVTVAAEGGEPKAANWLAMMHMQKARLAHQMGDHRAAQRSLDSANSWFIEGANNGSDEARHNLTTLYEMRQGLGL